jgi:hypothetical protein
MDFGPTDVIDAVLNFHIMDEVAFRSSNCVTPDYPTTNSSSIFFGTNGKIGWNTHVSFTDAICE